MVRKIISHQNFELGTIIDKIINNPQEFYEKIANSLSPQEREHFKNLILNKNCFNCTNGCCSVGTYEKSKEQSCAGWDNKELIGRQLVFMKKI